MNPEKSFSPDSEDLVFKKGGPRSKERAVPLGEDVEILEVEGYKERSQEDFDPQGDRPIRSYTSSSHPDNNRK